MSAQGVRPRVLNMLTLSERLPELGQIGSRAALRSAAIVEELTTLCRARGRQRVQFNLDAELAAALGCETLVGATIACRWWPSAPSKALRRRGRHVLWRTLYLNGRTIRRSLIDAETDEALDDVFRWPAEVDLEEQP